VTTFIEYELEDGLTILVEAPEDEMTGPVRAARDADGNIIKRSEKKFGEALDSIRLQAALMRKKLEDLRADEVEVTFGLKTTGELGNFAVGKVGLEANYAVTLKWKNTEEQKKQSRSG
jgi:hypothetical protein